MRVDRDQVERRMADRCRQDVAVISRADRSRRRLETAMGKPMGTG